MTLRSTARDAYRVALDFWGCLRRFVDGKAVNGYDDHMAEVLAEAGHAGQRSGLRVAEALAETERCARETGPTSTPEKHGPGSRPSGPNLRRESIAAGATLSNEADERQQIRDALVRTGAYLGESLSLMTRLTSAAPGTASPVAAAERPASSDTAASAAADAGHPASSAAHSQTADESPEATPPASGPPTFTAAELVDAAGAVTRMALLRGVASGNVAYWLALSAKFYDAADAIGDASTPPEYTALLADIGRDAVLETLANDPDSVHGRALRHEDERQK